MPSEISAASAEQEKENLRFLYFLNCDFCTGWAWQGLCGGSRRHWTRPDEGVVTTTLHCPCKHSITAHHRYRKKTKLLRNFPSSDWNIRKIHRKNIKWVLATSFRRQTTDVSTLNSGSVCTSKATSTLNDGHKQTNIIKYLIWQKNDRFSS